MKKKKAKLVEKLFSRRLPPSSPFPTCAMEALGRSPLEEGAWEEDTHFLLASVP